MKTSLLLSLFLISSSNSLNLKMMSTKPSSFISTKFISTRFSILDALFNFDKEKNRKFRRTVFTREDWIKHRDNKRYLRDFFSMPFSLVLRGLTVQALSVMLWSIFLVLYNMTIEHLIFVFKLTIPIPVLSLPSLPVSLMSSSLGLLLVFRTNKAYSRWEKARMTWATISSKSFDLIRQAILWIPDKTYKTTIIRQIIAFSRVLKWYVSMYL